MQKAISHSKKEAKLNNKQIYEATAAVESDAKHTFKKQKSDAVVRGKLERDHNRITSLEIIKQKQRIKMVYFYDKEKERIISNTNAGD